MRVSALTVSLGLALAGCSLPLHTPPPTGAPAATVKLRLGHHYVPHGSTIGEAAPFHAPRLRSQIAIDERELPHEPRTGVTSTWTRVRPGWRHYAISSHWIEAYYALVQESYYESRTTTCYQNVCSYTMGKTTCSYRNTTCTKQELRWRTVRRLRYRHVARCSAGRQIHMRAGVTYLLTYAYVGPGACNLTCHVQQFQPDGSFVLSPCAHVRSAPDADE